MSPTLAIYTMHQQQQPCFVGNNVFCFFYFFCIVFFTCGRRPTDHGAIPVCCCCWGNIFSKLNHPVSLPSEIVVGHEPPSIFVILSKGGHTPFWNHSGRMNLYFCHPVKGGVPLHSEIMGRNAHKILCCVEWLGVGVPLLYETVMWSVHTSVHIDFISHYDFRMGCDHTCSPPLW